jgi:hypothetical protein
MLQCKCPNCDRSYAIPLGANGRSTCVGCGKRFLIANLESELEGFQRTQSVCEIVHCAKKFSYSAYRVDQDAVSSLMGSSTSIGDEVFAHAWLVSEGDQIGLFINGKFIGLPHRSVTSNYLNPSLYSSSPFEHGPCALRTVCKLIRAATKSKAKCQVKFCLFEYPDTVPEKVVSLNSPLSEMKMLRGSFVQGMAYFKDVTLDECEEFFSLDSDYSEVIRAKARSNPAGAKYFAGYENFNLRNLCEWKSNDRRYRVKMGFKFKDLEIRKIYFSDTPSLPAVSWLSEPPKKRQRKFDGSRRIPIIWSDWGRSAAFELSCDNNHVPTELHSTDLCHFWTRLIVFEEVSNQGVKEVVFGSDRGSQAAFDSLQKGEEVKLEREPDNSFDPNAVKVLTEKGEKIGYLPGKLAQSMNQGNLNAVAVIDEHHGFTVKLLICVARNETDSVSLRDYAKRVYDAYPDASW